MKYLLMTTIIICCFSNITQAQKREAGKWESINLSPGVGRIVDIEFDPENGDRMYAAPDANGIWYTENQGRNWECITDNIPDIEARICNGEIVVDPINFNKIYYISKYGDYYISENRGENWQKVEQKDGTPVILTDFKRTIVSRSNQTQQLIMVSTTIGKDHGKKSASWEKGMHVSVDEGRNWKHFPNPSKNDQFLEVAFHPTNSQIIYAPSSNHLYKSINSGESFEIAMDFPQPCGSFSSVATIPSQPDWVYIITTNKSDKTAEDNKPKSALYLSKDTGITWDTIQNMENGIGYDESVYGPGFVGSWLHCFSVNSYNPNEMITGKNVMAETKDGGKTWENIPWNHRAQARMNDGSIVLNKFGKHIADNHVIKFHPKYKSRIYKACDSGLYLRDPENGLDDWLEITGDMQAMLFYSVKVNEFGDRYIAGNTQDCDIQSYQYGKWQWVRGYEGDVVFIHPYTNTAYFPYCGCNEGAEIKGLFDLGKGNSPSITSWGRPQIAVNYRNPDEAVILYQAPHKNRSKRIKQAFHIKDKGISADTMQLPTNGAILSFNISRTMEERFTAISADTILMSYDKGESWQAKTAPANNITFGTVDPENPDRIWLSSKDGKVFETIDAGNNWQNISDGLKDASILKLIYHEGSERDLYALVVEGDGQFMRPKGIYYLNNKTNKWERWMNNYKLNGFSDMVIDYPSQKLLASSYGRGIWEADLVGTYERFLNDNFGISQNRSIKNMYSFKVNLPYHIPDYYNFSWKVNGNEASNNSIHFVSKDVKADDIITCQLSPKYSPDIILNADPLTVTKLKAKKPANKKRQLHSTGGSVDLGYFDMFGNQQDFSVEFMLKPDSNGVVISNRRFNNHDAKGWMIHFENDSLVVSYSAKYNTAGGGSVRQKGLPKSTEQLRFQIDTKKWSKVLVSFDRDKKVQAFIDDKLVAEEDMNRDDKNQSLNSLFNLHLFSDVFKTHTFEGSIDELSIWQKAMTPSEIKNAPKENLIFHHSFNGKDVNDLNELFTDTKAKISGNIQSVSK